MSKKTAVEFIEEWQTGAFLVIGSALVGGVATAALGPYETLAGVLFVFFFGAVFAFMGFSYLLYGR
ncbi:hypothetical protein G3A49_00885 [Haloferax volcanii]|uniref:DUF8144 domain-containing protein n=3 Tax=Haloferax TaxID=2251 RepID=A0A558GBT2_HALVO|nr:MULTISPECIES: hypothetical protein [Haloferax]ELZ70236.1 hypothetical protein C456_17537 [Haloferax lucentense DSM 14919]QIB76776.1 hypothetical protein G3A49_00885 [Haloferax alexandrinus]RDZ30066.1 hypothetical protein DEQ67_15850 [Haloferax sp. Atlit-48N]RDZ41830.1 hypothetical protein C5B89_07790 [Haloferax sp. Atlit-47N]TVT95221.1 hypothetical protein FQA18_07650 [Haloferax volcanii]